MPEKEKRRRPWPFGDEDDFFGQDVEEMFEQMRRRMERLVESAFQGVEPGKMQPGRPFVYGYTFKVGPDGRPEFQEFGDTHALRAKPGLPTEEGREPLTDVIEREENLSITVELPGVDKDEIDMRISEDRLIIKVDSPERKYYKEVDLPSLVDPDSVKATFKNGVLDIVLRKVGGSKGKRVRIE
jgi:HSP20 family protein